MTAALMFGQPADTETICLARLSIPLPTLISAFSDSNATASRE
jgi:hypothetical protein